MDSSEFDVIYTRNFRKSGNLPK
ncbi:hypothetical protein J7Q84_06980 [Bacillus sp. 165]|nr:hypothetical protein [Bacillus sp. 165]